MTSLFVSYSRKDIEVARKLTEAFKGQGLDFWIDWEGIPPTVDWWKEIEKGIEEADIFLFLLSPDSAESKVCKREIEHATKNGKRLIPVVIRDIKTDEAPAKFRSLNWIFIRENDDFKTGFDKLIIAIHTDYEWVQVHRQLQLKALEWEKSNKENSFLLRGKELQSAELQLASNSSKEPFSTELQREYVSASRKAKIRQLRILASISAIAFIIIIWLAYTPVKSWLTTPEMPDWTLISFYQGDSPRVVAMNLQNPDEVYALGQLTGELYRSTDGGEAWHTITSLDAGTEIIGLAAVEDKVYALTDQAVWITRNGGKSWSSAENLPLDARAEFLSISVNPNNGNEVYIGSNNGIVYHTKDIGKTWDIVQPGYGGTSINSITTNRLVIILATEEGLWVQNIEDKVWNEISLVGCSERSDGVNALAFTYPYSGASDDGAYGFIAAVSGTGVCDTDSKNLYGNTLLIPDNAEIASLSIADQADLFAYEGYIVLNDKLLHKRIWRSNNIEWWKIKIGSFLVRSTK